MAQLTFDEEHHKYFDGDVEIPSVTTITRFCSYDSINGMGMNPFYRERGTLVHELTADYDLTGELPQGTGVDGFLIAYANFVRDYRPKWDFVEYMVGSKEQGFAGTVDRIGYIDGNLSILDIKTSSKPNILALTAQLTGYDLLTGSHSALYGLQLQKTGKYRLIPIEHDIGLFLACQTLHQKGIKK